MTSRAGRRRRRIGRSQVVVQVAAGDKSGAARENGSYDEVVAAAEAALSEGHEPA